METITLISNGFMFATLTGPGKLNEFYTKKSNVICFNVWSCRSIEVPPALLENDCFICNCSYLFTLFIVIVVSPCSYAYMYVILFIFVWMVGFFQLF